jgi:hypothetical protein
VPFFASVAWLIGRSYMNIKNFNQRLTATAVLAFTFAVTAPLG